MQPVVINESPVQLLQLPTHARVRVVMPEPHVMEHGEALDHDVHARGVAGQETVQ